MEEYNIDTKVYLIYCDIGSYKKWIRDCTDPQKYFSNYKKLLLSLDELTHYIGQYEFRDPTPGVEKHAYEAAFDENTRKFLYRAWDSTLNKVASAKSISARRKRLSDFFYNMSRYEEHLSQDNLEILRQFKNDLPDLQSVKKKEAPPPAFNKEQETFLVDNLRAAVSSGSFVALHYALNPLISFYYKYRNLDSYYVDLCAKLCKLDIQYLPKIDEEYTQKRLEEIENGARFRPSEETEKYRRDAIERGFFADIPAFDKLYMIYYNSKKYPDAISICRKAISHYKSSHGQDKFLRRISVCMKKQINAK